MLLPVNKNEFKPSHARLKSMLENRTKRKKHVFIQLIWSFKEVAEVDNTVCKKARMTPEICLKRIMSVKMLTCYQ